MFPYCANIFVADPRQRQVRHIGAILGSHAQRYQRFVDPARQQSQPGRSRLDRREQHLRMVRVGIIPEAGDRDRERRWRRNPIERGPQFLQPLPRPFPDELSRDVQIFERRPAQRRERAQFRKRLFEVGRYVPARGDSREEPHRLLFCHVMARLRVIHWKPAESGALIEACRACGHEVEYDGFPFPVLAKTIRHNQPDALVIDLTRLPSYGREAAMAIRRTKYSRHIPIIFVDGAADKVEAVRKQLPDATFSTRGQLCSRIRDACANPVTNPVAPPSVMERYGSRTKAQKLGIRPGSTVAVIDPPRGYATALG